jgi:hypothetical protein
VEATELQAGLAKARDDIQGLAEAHIARMASLAPNTPAVMAASFALVNDWLTAVAAVISGIDVDRNRALTLVKALTATKASPVTPEGAIATQLRGQTWQSLADEFLSCALQEAFGQRSMNQFLSTLGSNTAPTRVKSLVESVPKALHGWQSGTREVWRAPLERAFKDAVFHYTEHVVQLPDLDAVGEIATVKIATTALMDLQAGRGELADAARLQAVLERVDEKTRRCHHEQQKASVTSVLERLQAKLESNSQWEEEETLKCVEEVRQFVGYRALPESLAKIRVVVGGLAQEAFSRMKVFSVPSTTNPDSSHAAGAEGGAAEDNAVGASTPVASPAENEAAEDEARDGSSQASTLGQPPPEVGDASSNSVLSLARGIQAWVHAEDPGARALEFLSNAQMLNTTVSQIMVAVTTRAANNVKDLMKTLNTTLLKEEPCVVSFPGDAVTFLGASSHTAGEDMLNTIIQIRSTGLLTAKRYAKTLVDKTKQAMNAISDAISMIAGGTADGSSWKNGCQPGADWNEVEKKITEHLFEMDHKALNDGIGKISRAIKAYVKCAEQAKVPADEIASSTVPAVQTLGLARATIMEARSEHVHFASDQFVSYVSAATRDSLTRGRAWVFWDGFGFGCFSCGVSVGGRVYIQDCSIVGPRVAQALRSHQPSVISSSCRAHIARMLCLWRCLQSISTGTGQRAIVTTGQQGVAGRCSEACGSLCFHSVPPASLGKRLGHQRSRRGEGGVSADAPGRGRRIHDQLGDDGARAR